MNTANPIIIISEGERGEETASTETTWSVSMDIMNV